MRPDQPKMKIAFVSDVLYPYNKGGKETRLYQVSSRLVKRGHSVHIYCMKWWKGDENYRMEDGVHLHAMCKYYPLYAGKRRSMKQAIFFALSCFKLVKEDFDLVEADHMPHTVLFSTKIICMLKRKKLIVAWNEVWGREYWKKYLGVLGNVAYIVETLSVLTPDRIVSVSDLTTNKLRQELLTKKDITTIPDGVESDHIQQIKPASTKSDVIFVGRLLSHKNVDLLIEAIDLVKEKRPDISCLVIGDGPEKIRLEKKVAESKLNNNISFLGFLENHDDVYSYIKSSKVFVLPSLREGFGIVVIEANACGIPVITIEHETNAAKDLIIQGQNGYVCEPNAKEIAEKIMHIVSDTSSWETKELCKDTVQKYDWDKTVDRIEDVYTK